LFIDSVAHLISLQVRKKKKTRRRRNKSTQKILSYITLTKRAHLANEKGAPSHESPRISTRTYLSAS
jgi:hypothetical protein